MIVAKNLADFNAARSRFEGKTIGFVPTMGALHEGHASLIRKAVEECDAVVVSDFVNPTQFNNQNDFNTYPRTLDQDCAFVEKLGVEIVFAPGVKDVYPEGSDFDSKVFDLGGLDEYGEGPRRPGHFNGMAQIVTRLFDIVRPSKAYFGEKDFQQLAIIEYFTKNLNYPIEIVRCPIARAEDGLALSSRNELLTAEQRAVAPHIYKCICEAVEMVGKIPVAQAIEKITKAIDSEKLLRTEYVEIINSLTLQPINDWDEAEQIRLSCAVYADPVRLIDNIKLK
ncbi:MAG: pantoate--beta-alanine ligase [Bacteroidales bacterium]|jgi:pantoate--beta-alanine ligase|nr:pantoate--beta-alanine ligase [Bacteroidales bacterium]MBO7321972.1 pantoate--beta-alanine ligase [Bacteroidales bacterium]MBQ5747539.1 pantoate--beta-alanine ligase [Bacteroidales bacterium]MBQ5881664.1 pantoate--beta-alanine ligase [Bacteroidales bacterium]